MPLFNSSLITSAAAADSTPAEDPVTRSLRFNGSVSSSEAGHLYRTAGTPTDEGKWTMSMWVKVGQQPTNGYMTLFGAGASNNNAAYTAIYNGMLYADQATSNNHRTIKCSGALFRDPNAWYHLCFAYDNSQSGSSGNNQNAYKWYVNGVRLTEPTYSNNESVFGYTNRFNSSGFVQRIGKAAHRSYNSTYKYHWDGLIANVHFVDGQQLEPTEFIESNDYGGYKPKEYTGTYGNNGFHLDMQPSHDADLLVTSVGRNDGDTQFADAAQGHGLTVSGDTEHSIAVGNPFTGDDRAIYFDGNNDTVAVTTGHSDFAFGTGDFTVEGWYYFKSIPSGTDAMLVDLRPTNSTDTDTFAFSTDTTNGVKVYSGANYALGGSLSTNTWHHIALVRDSGTLYAYIDGTATGTTQSFSNDLTANSTPRLGATADAGTSAVFTGYIFDVRITKGTARYTSNFTPPTSKLETEDSDTKLLIQPHKDDTDFHDETSNSHALSVTDSPTRTASSPYEAAAKSTAIHFDGSADCLTTSTSTDLAIASGDSFTAECWVYINNNASNTYDGIFSGYLGSTNTGWSIEIDGGDWGVYDSGGGRQKSSTAATTGEWHHVALVKTDNTTNGARLYLNGNKIHDVTISSNLTSARPITLGSYYASDGYSMDGYMFDARFTKGEEKYTGSTYDTPTAPFELNPVYLGADQSGNKNHFTPTNISSHDVMLDVPTKNYATLNSLDAKGSAGSDTFREGNLDVEFSNIRSHAGTVAATGSGKYYAEVYYKSGGSSNRIGVGVVSLEDRVKDNTGYSVGTSSTNEGGAIAVFGYAGQVFNNLGSTPTNANYLAQNAPSYAAIAVGDIVQIALDLDAGTVKFGLNGDWYNNTSTSAFASAQTVSLDKTKIWTWLVGGQDSSSTERVILNAGQDPTFANNKPSGQDSSQGEFYYAPPTGFKSLNSSNLDDPSVTPSENFEIAQWVGNETAGKVISTDISPDLVWIKNRDEAKDHTLGDSLRGANKILKTNSTASESPAITNITAFDTNASGGYSFTLGDSEKVNDSGKNHVGWVWKANQTPSASYSYSNTLTLTVENFDYNNGWGTTKLEVIEGSTSLGFVSSPDYDNEYSGYYAQYDIKTDDISKIKLVWRTVDSTDPWYDIYAYLENSSSTELASWDGSSYYGGGGEGPDAPEEDDVFYPSSGHDSTNASTTGVLELSGGATVEDNSEKYNDAAGFTMFTYTGNSSSDNDMMLFNHSLGVPIDFAIGKCRSTASASGGKWVVWHKDLVNDDGSLYLNESESESNTNGNNYDEDSSTIGWFQNVTSGAQHQVKIRNVLIYDGSNTDTVRMVDNSKDFVFYGFAGVEGYSKFGSYTGNGSADGTFIYLGFRPAFFMLKRIDGSGEWWMYDSKRDGYNVIPHLMMAQSSAAESSPSSSYYVDFVSNGVKLRNGLAACNGNGNDFIYAAFSEQPFAAPSNAR